MCSLIKIRQFLFLEKKNGFIKKFIKAAENCVKEKETSGFTKSVIFILVIHNFSLPELAIHSDYQTMPQKTRKQTNKTQRARKQPNKCPTKQQTCFSAFNYLLCFLCTPLCLSCQQLSIKTSNHTKSKRAHVRPSSWDYPLQFTII